MRVLRAAAAFILLLGLFGCGGSQPPVMPTVVGQKLDVALSDVKRAGFSNDVEVLGGGVLGIIDKSNWTVCEQEPAAGQAIADTPRLKVDRACGDTTSSAATPSGVPAPSPSGTTPATPPTSAPSAASAQPLVTVQNNAEFAAVSVLGDYCGAPIAEFAQKYAGRIIQFDGSIGALNNHGSYKTRYDILVNFGDDGKGTKGPAFQIRDVNITYDLKLTGANIPDNVRVGDNLRVTAAVDEYEAKSCLFLLEPVSIQYR